MLGEELGECQGKITHRRILPAAASMLCLALVLSPIANVQAAELQILAGGAMTGPLRELAAQFESASGHKLVFRFGTTPELIKLATTGGPFDLGVVPVDVIKDAAAQAQFASGPTTDIARVGLGVAVRSGAHKPDISTPDALKQTLLKAQSIATIPASATGTQVLRVFERLGISEAMKAKTKAQPTPAQVVQAGCQRRGRARSVSPQRVDGAWFGCGRPVPRRTAAGSSFHGGRRCEYQRSGSRQGVHHLPDDSRRHRGDKGQRYESGLRDCARKLCNVAAGRVTATCGFRGFKGRSGSQASGGRDEHETPFAHGCVDEDLRARYAVE